MSATELAAKANRPHRARHVFPIFATALMGVIMSMSAWWVVFRWEDRAAELEFNARASNMSLLLQAGVNEYFNKIVALRALFESAAQGVSRSEFEMFANRLLRDQAAILSVSWIPRIKHDERAEHEVAAVRDGIADYHITSVADGRLAISPQKDEYFPVYYTTEKQFSRPVYGLDVGDGGMREQTLKRARDGDHLAASEQLVLQSGTGDRRGFFVVLPVYRQGLRHNSVEDRDRNLAGFVQGVFQTKQMVDTILAGLLVPVDLYVFAPSAGPDALPINVHGSMIPTEKIDSMRQNALETGPHWSGALMAADIEWKLVAVPAGGSASHHRNAWILMIAGLLVTGVGVAFMWRSSSHSLHLERANQMVSELAQTDSLTTLANRRAFLSRLAASFAASGRAASPFAMLYIDLDHFKDVNDTLGHPVGDGLLQHAAQRLKEAVRENDIVARIGGDEFAVLQTDAADLEAAGTLAGKIVATLAAPYVIDGNEVHVTASVGVSHYFGQFAGLEAMLMQADLALYRAKRDGRNCFRLHSGVLNQEVRERLKIADELRGAIERRELHLHYQPQVDLASGKIIGLEALLRWNHPKRGQISPSLFIPIAERTGTIIPLGRWAFEEACRQLNSWDAEGIAPDVVAVNISAIQCKRSGLERDIAESLARWRINPGKMELELTESVLMEVTQQNRDVIERLQKLGLKIAIDDFGTGYSSLNYLTTYPVDRLKVAQELVFRVTTCSRNATVVQTAIRLAQELGIALIAEGVETEAQARFLISAGCGSAQGYYFSPPVSAERATELLRQRIIKPMEQPVTDQEPVAA
jgi:diguanylate cyclase (GGDEF)-like protein